ncbi:hypothetical protein AC251_14380 [Ralstonia pseudosolanacearum]|nr:hypothetical protein AC251_14380 [Ralstonia pseudosolanacearum]
MILWRNGAASLCFGLGRQANVFCRQSIVGHNLLNLSNDLLKFFEAGILKLFFQLLFLSK